MGLKAANSQISKMESDCYTYLKDLELSYFAVSSKPLGMVLLAVSCILFQGTLFSWTIALVEALSILPPFFFLCADCSKCQTLLLKIWVCVLYLKKKLKYV